MKKILLILILTATALVVNAQVKIAHASRIEADFQQTRTSQALTEPEYSTGKFLYSYPDSVKWEYDSADAIKIPKVLVHIISKMNEDESENPAIKKDFELSWEGNTLTIVPKKKILANLLNSMSITFNKDGVADRVFVDEKSGNTTDIKFINMTFTKR